MSFIDEIKIYVKAGDGGNGHVSFRREKFIEFGGPDGGNGGNGGDIVFLSTRSKNTLLHLRYLQHIRAANGDRGGKKNSQGHSGKEFIVLVPVGTQIFDSKSNLIKDFDIEDERYLIAKGGRGGIGNACFKRSNNRTPREFTEGVAGEELELYLKLKVLSDVGLIGLPNVGKSTFLSLASNAKPKIANYSFTTLEPNLGMVDLHERSIVFADLPGIIEGANEGAGLGKKFLKHIERCKILLHLVDVSDDKFLENYQVIREELTSYNQELSHRKEIIVLSKTDLISKEELKERRKKIALFLQKDDIFELSFKNGIVEILEKVLELLEVLIPKKKFVYDPSSNI